MKLKLSISIAASLLMARWKQTLVAAVGVTFGITMFIALLGFMNGLNDLLDGLVINRTPHIRLYNEIKPSSRQPVNEAEEYKNAQNFIASIKSGNSRQAIYNSAAIMHALEKDTRVSGIAPKITAQVFFNNGVTDITGMVNGIDVEKEALLFHFNDYIVKGAASANLDFPNSIVLGKGLADKLLAAVGDVVQVSTASGERFPLKVVGYFQSGLQEVDKTQSFVSVVTLQKMLGKSSSYITDIQVRLKDINAAPALAREYSSRYGTDAEDIQTANAQFETGSFIRSLISYAVGITLLIVAGFGIYNILNMMIYEKMDSIAILKATGFSGKDVKLIFIGIALSIGFVGGLLGLFFGFWMSFGIEHIPFHTPALPTIKTYPVNFSPVYYFTGIAFALVTTYLAGWFPARKAGAVDPVVIIRAK